MATNNYLNKWLSVKCLKCGKDIHYKRGTRIPTYCNTTCKARDIKRVNVLKRKKARLLAKGTKVPKRTKISQSRVLIESSLTQVKPAKVHKTVTRQDKPKIQVTDNTEVNATSLPCEIPNATCEIAYTDIPATVRGGTPSCSSSIERVSELEKFSDSELEKNSGNSDKVDVGEKISVSGKRVDVLDKLSVVDKEERKGRLIKYFKNGIIADWYLRPDQLRLYRMLRDGKRVLSNTHRRWGKSTTTFVYIFERCIREKIIVRAGGITQKSFREIFITLLEHIYGDCMELAPRYLSRDDCWLFESGSRIYLFGVKDKDESAKARGNEADIIYCDEYGFWKYRPRYTLTHVLGPQLDTTNGQMIITSTIPPDLTHDFITQIASASAGKYYFYQDVHMSLEEGIISDEQHERILERCGGVMSDAYRIEYELRDDGAKDRLVIPEACTLRVGTIERPPSFDSYVCFDLGLVDNTAVLFGYLDFTKGNLVIEREYFEHYKSTEDIVKECKRIERELGYDKPKRIGDNEMQQLFDMGRSYGYTVVPVSKRKKESNKGYRDSVINQLRVGLDKILINEEMCPNLAQQLRFGIWNVNRTDFERTETMGHLDALMAMCYFFDNVNWRKNPYKIGEFDDEGRKILPSTHEIIKTTNGKKSLRDIL